MGATVAWFISLIASASAFLRWVYLMAMRARARDPSISPRACVVTYFIPIVHLYVPYALFKKVARTLDRKHLLPRSMDLWWYSFVPVILLPISAMPFRWFSPVFAFAFNPAIHCICATVSLLAMASVMKAMQTTFTERTRQPRSRR